LIAGFDGASARLFGQDPDLVCCADEINSGSDNRPLVEKTVDPYAANLLMPPYLNLLHSPNRSVSSSNL